MSPSFAFLLGSALLLHLAGLTSAAGFETGITNTKCNLDPSRAQVNNPCPTLYDAECDGNYCKCPRGLVEHSNLHKCVPGQGDGDDDDDPFADLPFDYVPPGQTTTPRPRQQFGTTTDLTRTPCTAGNDPCPSLHMAECTFGYCKCAFGYVQAPNGTVCVRDNAAFNRDNPDSNRGGNTGNRGNTDSNMGGNTGSDRGNTGFNRDSHDDHDHTDDHDDHHDHTDMDHDHADGDDDSWFSSAGVKSNGGVLSMVASLMVCSLLARR